MNIINIIKNFFKKIKNKNLLEISEKTERNLDKLVIFDWGGVIESHSEGEYNLYKAIESILKRFNTDLESENNLGKRYVKFLVNKKEDETRDSFTRVKEEFNLNCTREEFESAYEGEFNKIEYYKDVVEFIHSIKKYCKIGILSNLGKRDKNRLDKQVDLKQFDYVWLSFELKVNKPKEEIYKIVEEECKLESDKILFIDDAEENLIIPKQMGWNVLQASGHELEIIKKNVFKFLNI